MKTLEKKAEEWLFKQEFFIDDCKVSVNKIDGVVMSEIPKIVTAFHKHALEELLNEWTDERIKQFNTKEHFHHEAGRHYRTRVERITGAKQFRDELKRSLNQEK
jgi:hypothetical protein